MLRNDERVQTHSITHVFRFEMPFRNDEPLDDILAHARTLFGEQPIEDDESIIYGPLILSVAPKARLSSPRS